LKKLLIAVFILTIFASYGHTAENPVSCRIKGVTVETKSIEECNTIGGVSESSYLFVINFDTGSYDGKTLQLNGNGSSNVIFFTDRPERKAGHMGVKKFKSIWTKGIGSFKSDPPNATLSVIDKGKDLDSVMTLSNPRIKDNSIIFDVDLIDGSPPKNFNTGGLFIDPLIHQTF